MCQMAQEQGNTNQRITSVVTFRINNSTIAFTTDHGTHFFHFSSNVYFAYGRSKIFLAILTGYITQSTCRTQVRNCITRSMFQHIIGYAHQRIFFAIHFSIFANHCQAVYVRVNYESYISLATFHQVHNVPQILFKRFRIMLEITGRFAVKLLYMLYTQLLQ